MQSFFHQRSEGRIYIKAHTKTVLCDAVKKVNATEWLRLGIKYENILNLDSNEFWLEDLPCNWDYMYEIMKKMSSTKEILIISDYIYYDQQYYGDCVKVYFYCGGKSFYHKYHSDQREFFICSRVAINNPKDWIDFMDFELSRESTIILANFGIRDLKRGIQPIKFSEIKDELCSLGITILPMCLHVIAIQHLGFFGIVIVFLATYLTFRLKEKMRFKIMFVLNLIISIICFCVALLIIAFKVLKWTYLLL